ncbi:MAG: ATP-binding protein [Actinomycetota bacterium]|nr:ATP-binding protein [Actinomycetota bacterium]
MKRRDNALSLVAGALVLLALLAVFAIELSNTQAKSRSDVSARVHDRGVLAAALIDSLFQTVGQQIPQDQGRYGARTVTARAMEAAKQQNLYAALLGPSGAVLAHSSGLTAQVRAELPGSAALAMVHAGRPYGLGDVLPYGRTSVIDLAARFPTPYGERILVAGIPTQSLAAFLQGELRRIPGVKGSHNYLLDARGTVIGSTNPGFPVGHRFDTASRARDLSHLTGDAHGYHYVQVPISNSTWRLLLSAPEGALFASVSGVHKWIPWLIFLAFGLMATLALALARRALGAAAEIHLANGRLGEVNDELGRVNAVLQRRAAELARSNAELDQFASIASHDLQEPLRKVRTFTQQVIDRESADLSERGRDYLQRANGAAERMQRLVEDLLKFSRVSTQGRAFCPVDLGRVTAEVLEDLAAQVTEAGTQVRVGELPTVSGDALQLRQLIQNLLSNALKFRRSGVTPEVKLSARVDGDTVTLTVEDNGIGFDPQYDRRIFRVFERLHGRTEYPGTGIGLALCRKIAERHGGGVVADAVPGVGATFTVTLPLDQTEEVLPNALLDADGTDPSEPEKAYATV